VDEQEIDAWAGKAQEMAGDGQDQSSAPTAGKPETEQGSRGARKKKGGGMKMRTDLQIQRKAGT
jgi:hypothetical protein